MEDQETPKILFPYDFAPESNYAMKYLGELAKVFDYSVEILNILDPGTKKYLQENNLKRSDLPSKVGQLASEFQNKYNIPATYLLKNAPIKRIRRISEREKVEFTFLAINEPDKMASKIMKVVTTSPVPAFVVQDNVNYKPIKKILFPLDDSVTSRQKAGWALRFARKTGAVLHIFSINPAALPTPEKVKKQRTVIDSVEWFFAKHHIENVIELSTGTYDEFDNDILKYANKIGIDLFIIMIPLKIFKSINQHDFKLIFNPNKIPILCVNQRDLFLGGGIT